MESVEKNFGWSRSDSKDSIHFEVKTFKQKVYLVNQKGEAFEVKEKGGLEIMALGHVGQFAWRKAKRLKGESIG